MASLRDIVKQYQEELRDGIAWMAFWREDRSRLEDIKTDDHASRRGGIQ